MNQVINRIQKLRRLLMIHSYIYYRLNSVLVTDTVWDGWSNELIELQKEHGWQFNDRGIAPEYTDYDLVFRDWDGATGFHLPRDEWVADKAHYLMRITEHCREGINE